MIKFNLQLFALKSNMVYINDGASNKKKEEKKAGNTLNTQESIVDYLKSQGNDSSYAARQDLAKSLGISNYSGSYEQNVQMLNALKNPQTNSTPKPTKAVMNTNAPSPTPTNAVLDANEPAAQPTKTALNGVDQATLDKMNSSFTASEGTTNAQNEANSYLQNVKDLANTKDIISQDTWDAINKQFSASSAYNDAMNYTNGLLQQLSSGKTSYSDKVDAMIAQIQNRDPFSYDVDKDTLFQQALASAMNSGQTAMQNTIGQASDLTGGYGSSYATSAANQQYNAYIQDAYNNLPEYYQMALEAYQMEGEDMYNQLAMLSDADSKEYERLYNSWNANFSNAQNMYNNEYNAWRDSVNNAFNSAGLQLEEHGQLFDQAYNTYNAVANNAQQMYQNEYNAWADQVNNAFKNAGMLNQDYWNTTNFNEDVRQYNETLAFNKQTHADDMTYKYSALEQDKLQHEAEMTYKNNALKQDNDQFYASLNAKVGDNGNDMSYSELSNTELKAIEERYAQAGGGAAGEEAVDAYLSMIGKNNLSDEAMSALSDTLSNTAIPLQYQNWAKSKDTMNGIFGVGELWGREDGNDQFTYNGQTMTLNQLKKLIEVSDMSDEEKQLFLNKLLSQTSR